MKLALLLIGSAPIVVAAPALAQSMDHSMQNMPGMTMPAQPKAAPKRTAKPVAKTPAKPAAKPKPPAAPAAAPSMPGMEGMKMPGPPADPHVGHDMSTMPGMHGAGSQAGDDMQEADKLAGAAPAPAAPSDHAADHFYSGQEMDDARAELRQEHGGHTFSQVMLNLNEVQVRDGKDGYRWDGEAWFGGDITRLVLKSEGDATFGRSVDHAEVQALYSRAIDPYWNLQAGVRYDLAPGPSRPYAAIGFEGLTPYWFEVAAALFVSDRGDVLGRIEGYYDQRITQRLILQPRAELNFAAQDVRENQIGSGLNNVELGLRLRYEITHEFAPYIGVSFDRKLGNTAKFARTRGDEAKSTSFVFGTRTWF